jgi:dihydrolipoamide dehydrogenase
MAGENAMGRNFKVHVRTFIRVLFSHPDVASVGLSPKKAKQQSCDTVMGSTPLSMNPFGMLLSVNEGLIEVVAEKWYGEILGVGIIGIAVPEIASQVLLATQTDATLEKLEKTVFSIPL